MAEGVRPGIFLNSPNVSGLDLSNRSIISFERPLNSLYTKPTEFLKSHFD